MNGSRQEDGFGIATLIVFVMALSVGLAAVAPNYQLEVQRELEEELIFRGEEYVRAIQKYQRRFGVYPPTTDALLETNGIGFLRRAYVDPITGDEFRLLTATPTGGIEGSILYPDSSIPLFESNAQASSDSDSGQALLPEGGGRGPAGGTNTGGSEFGLGSGFQTAFGESSAFEGGDPRSGSGLGAQAVGGFEGSFGQGAASGSFGASGFGGGLGSGTGRVAGLERPLDFGQQSGTALGSFSGFSQAGFNSQSRSGLGQGEPSGAPGGSGGPTSSAFGPGAEALAPAGLSGIVGVAPTNSAPSLKVYNGRSTYMEWEFIALPRGLGGGGSDVPTSSQPQTFDEN